MCSCYLLLQIATGLQEAPDEISQHPRLSICWVWQIQINNLMMRRAGLSRWSGFWPHFECRSMMRMQQNSRWTWYDTVDFERHSMIRRQRLCRVRKCLQRAWSGKFKLYLPPSFDRTQLIKTLFPQETFFHARSISVQWNRCHVQTSWTDTTDQNIVLKAKNRREFTLVYICCNTLIRGSLHMICATSMAIF